MITIYRSDEDQQLTEIMKPEEGCWISVVKPSSDELEMLQEITEIDADDLKAPLDLEERSRLMLENEYTMVLVDIPTHDEEDHYETIPLGIYLTKDFIITICLQDSSILRSFAKQRVKEFYTFKKTRFLFQLLYRNATTYLRYLRIIDRKSDKIEEQLQKSQKNSELLELMGLEKSLVYFTTSLRSNEVVLEKLLRTDKVKKYPDDEDLLEDVIVENKQAIEMANIYSGILNGVMGTFASVISNNQNGVMKVLAIMTIVLSIPTIISGFYGMNFDNIPFAHEPMGFIITIAVAFVISGGIAFVLYKKNIL
ncbi:MAG: magnesium transporter CorA family protein [Eubacterium sp.]|nr:magnesium transporter CorA family protein [Eubacterium sp.]